MTAQTEMSTPATTSSGSRGNAFDSLRLIAAASVLIGHVDREFGTHVLAGANKYIDGVPLFFVMSGMLVYMSAERINERTGQWKDFYRNRFLRVAPAIYAFAIVVPVTFVAIGAVDASDVLRLPDIAAWAAGSALLVPGYEPSAWSHVGVGAVTWPLYTIPAEISFYLVVPLLVIAARRYGFNRMLATFATITIAGGIAYHLANPGIASPESSAVAKVLGHTLLQQGSCFAVGIWWARYWRSTPQSWPTAGVCCIAVVALTEAKWWPPVHALYPLLLSIPLGYVTMMVGRRGPAFLATLPRRIGDLSYGTYVWQYLAINVVMFYGLHGYAGSLTAIAATLLIAAASWFGVERPMLRRKRVSLRRQ